MKWWALLKQFPKYALVLGVIVGSTALFALWRFTHSRAEPRPLAAQKAAVDQAAMQTQAAKAEAAVGSLILVDHDLYDARTGEILFKHWLKGDAPIRLFYDPQAKKLYGQYDKGFARYAFDGTREAAMMDTNAVEFCDGFKKVVFARNKNVWMAEADWQNSRFVNERQVTSIDSFYENHFVENIFLLTGKTLVVRNLNNLLRVNLENGSVKPIRRQFRDLGNTRSPDSKWVVGTENGQFICYDVDADEAKAIPISQIGISHYQWLGNDRCLGLAAGKSIVVYDRLAHTLTEAVALPFMCFRIGEPSPDGRFIFAVGGGHGGTGALVDLEKKTATQVNGGAGIVWVSADTFASSREVPDSDLRGTWLQKAGESEKRVSPKPYLVSRGGPELLPLPDAGLIVFVTAHGIMKIKLDGTALEGLLKLPRPPNRALRIQKWEEE